MTGLGRTYFYGGAPVIETGPSFQGHCPSPEASTLQVLGCYRDASIYVLSVTKPELASVVDVTAAHEMLHAVYDGMDATDRAAVDPQLSAFYDASTDPHLKAIVAKYDQHEPGNRANELHSLIGTQITPLTPALDAYYAEFFRDRAPIAAAYNAYVSVFDGLISRYRDLDAQLDTLSARITSLRDQANAAGGEAQRLGSQIDSLRAQGRFGESNSLVPGQNDAVRRRAEPFRAGQRAHRGVQRGRRTDQRSRLGTRRPRGGTAPHRLTVGFRRMTDWGPAPTARPA